jgi:DNA-binding response OmpR family regulator
MPDGHAHVCPACGGVTQKASPVLVDLNSNTAVVGERRVPLSPKETEMLHVIAEQFPGFASPERILSRVYGAGEQPEGRIVYVMASRIRRKLRAVGVDLKKRNSARTAGGGGYCLESMTA